MSKDWSKTLATATRLIENYGRPVTLGKLVKTPAVTDEPWRGAQAPPTLDPAASKVGMKGVATGLLRSLGEDFIKGLDNVIVVAGDFDAKAFDVVLDGESRWRIVKTETLAPGPTRLIHFLGVVQ